MTKRIVFNLALAFTVVILAANTSMGQSDGLLSWAHSTGASSFGPATTATGYMNMWQDGSCVNGNPVSASVVETWACSGGMMATVNGQAGLTFNWEECIGDYPHGVWASASVSVAGVPVNNEWGG